VAGYLEESYYTVRKWWSLVKEGPWFAEVTDRGKLGFRVRMADDWLEWRAIKSPSSNGQMHNYALEGDEIAVNARSNDDEIHNRAFEHSGNKVLMESDQAPTPTQPPRASRTPDRAMVMMVGKGIKSEKALNEIASMGLDLMTVEQSIDNLLADRTGIGAIVKLLQSNPPEPGKPYPRSRAPAGRVTVDLPPVPERPSKTVLSASERRQLLEQHRNGSS
jgi:hypothetical protein